MRSILTVKINVVSLVILFRKRGEKKEREINN